MRREALGGMIYVYATGFQSQYDVAADHEFVIQLRGQSGEDFSLDTPPPDAERLLIKSLLPQKTLDL